MDSYRLIGTYNTDSGNLGNWGGPHSSIAFNAPGTLTPWGSAFAVSAFDAGASFVAAPYDVLNTSSGLGSDELNLTALLSSIGGASYNMTNAPVFNWNGNPSTPGFGCDSLQINNLIGGPIVINDTLNPSDWGLVRDYEMFLDFADSAGIGGVDISNYQDVNLKIDSTEGTMDSINNVQRGSLDFSEAGRSAMGIGTASPLGTISESVLTFQAGPSGDSLDVFNGSGTSTNYAGTTLVKDGSASLLDFYDNNGGNAIVLENSISSNLMLSGGTTAMSFISAPTPAGWEAATLAAGGDNVNLNPVGTGAANIVATHPSGVTTIENFTFGRDSLNMLLAGSGGYTVSDLFLGGNAALAQDNAAVITDSTGQHGFILIGMFANTAAPHISTALVGRNTYLHAS